MEPDHGLDAPATALAAVADGIEAVHQRVLEQRRVHMPAGMLLVQQAERLGAGQLAAFGRMVLQHELGIRFPDEHADLSGLAGVGAGMPARAFKRDNPLRSLQDKAPGTFVRNDLLQVLQGNVPVDGDDLLRLLPGEDLAVIPGDETNYG